MSITIKDIAKLAGVSHTTVSRVLNQHSNVKHEIRKKVLGIIEKLNYQPHDSARALVSGKTHNIGLLVLYDV